MLAGLHVAPKRNGVNGDIDENNLLSNMEWRRALGFFLQVTSSLQYLALFL